MNLGLLLHELKRNLRQMKHRTSVQMAASDRPVMESLEQRGFAVIESGYSSDQLATMRQEVDRIMEAHKEQLWKDAQGSDHRLFGANNVSEALNDFHHHPKAGALLNAYMHSAGPSFGTLMAGKITATDDNTGSGGGWHRDTADFKQVKSIIYLSDVGPENGPFQYIEGSHLLRNISKATDYLGVHWRERRFEPKALEKACDQFGWKVTTLTAPAGSIVLANTRGLHRGMPLQSGLRYALTNYLWYNEPVAPHIKDLIVS